MVLRVFLVSRFASIKISLGILFGSSLISFLALMTVLNSLRLIWWLSSNGFRGIGLFPVFCSIGVYHVVYMTILVLQLTVNIATTSNCQ